MGDYILGLIAVAMLCAVAAALSDQDSIGGKLVKRMAAIVMVISILRPALQLRPISYMNIWEELSDGGQLAISEGERTATVKRNEIIISRTTAYILDIAEDFGADLVVDVSLQESGLPVPAQVTLRGTCSPYARQRISEMIAGDLDIEREDQVWIVEN